MTEKKNFHRMYVNFFIKKVSPLRDSNPYQLPVKRQICSPYLTLSGVLSLWPNAFFDFCGLMPYLFFVVESCSFTLYLSFVCRFDSCISNGDVSEASFQLTSSNRRSCPEGREFDVSTVGIV